VAEPDRGRRDWSQELAAQTPVYANRRRIRGARGRRLTIRQANRAERPHTLFSQRSIAERFLTSSERAVVELDTVRTASRTEMDNLLRKQKAAALKQSSYLEKSLRYGIHRRRKALEHLTSQVQSAENNFNFNYVVIDTPLFTLPSRDIDLVSTSLAPWNNIAKINAEWNTPYPDNGFDDLSFVYVWENPSERPVVVNVESYLMLNGFCDAFAEGGPGPRSFWGDKYTDLDVGVDLNVFEYWNNPPTSPSGQAGQAEYALRLSADGGGIFGLGGYDSGAVIGTFDVIYKMFLVPPKGVAVFEIVLDVFHRTEGGYIELDFASGDFEIMCPAVVIAILG
jgi:hypothetical protein